MKLSSGYMKILGKTIALHDRIIEKVNIEEQNKKACDVLAQQGFSELEIQMVKLQQANPGSR